MITIAMWKEWCDEYAGLGWYLVCTLFSPFSIICDVALLPFEIIAFIVWKIRKG